VPTAELSFRDGSASDLAATFALCERARRAARAEPAPSDVEIREDWSRRRSFVEYVAAQPDGRYVIAEDGDGPIGYARVVRFAGMEELTDLMVSQQHRGRGIGRRLLELAWPGDPTAELGRLVVAALPTGGPGILLGRGVMPVAGHWELRARRERYLELRSHELEDSLPAVHVLKRDRAAAEWKRLEPRAIAYARPSLHDFFGRDRTCLAVIDEDGAAQSLCWVSSDAEIGPAVAAVPGGLVPVMLAALDRVAMIQQPDELRVSATTLAWWLLRRLTTLAFTLVSTGWILCSVPLPGLDRYVPSRLPELL
jgi:GNAT superfamily N-acetyltransferase